MGNFRNWLARFMYGRYGVDQLYFALFAAYLVLLIVNSFVRSTIINILLWVLVIWMIYRVLSRNIYKRRMENEKFLQIWNPVKANASLTFRRIKEIKTHRYLKCPNCHTMLRLPRKTGKHTVKCPCCSNKFKVQVWF